MLTREQRVVWFVLRDSGYEELQPDDAGIFCSETLPGLWLHAPALWQSNLAGMLATVQQGIATPEHQAFVEALTNRSS
ncbi:MAG: hypothetical protein R2932_45865 [Caldilineaceae bacterium]